MRQGWSDKEAAPVLGVAVGKVSQAMTPALTKVARLMRADPVRTLRSILEAMEDLPSTDSRPSSPEPLTLFEMDTRERMLDGRANRHDLGMSSQRP